MAYNTKDLYDKALLLIKKHKLFFINDIVQFLPCTRATFYEHFPAHSDKLNTLKELLEANKIEVKAGLRAKMLKSRSSSDTIALYKLLATDEERRSLSQQYIDHTTKDEKIQPQITGIEIVRRNAED